MRKILKHKIIEESGSIDRIVEEAYHAIHAQPQSIDLIINLPAIHTIKNTLQKQRRKTRPPVPQTIEQLPSPLPGVYCKTAQEHWYSDGTFYTCPSIFYQIYSIHAYCDGMSTPCIFALLGGKFEQIYVDLFSVIFRKMFECHLIIRLRTITIDFELGVSNVFTKYYHSVIVRGCLLNFWQSLFRKFIDLGLKTAYNNDENLRNWFRSFASLSLLPLNHMLQGLQCLILTRSEYPSIQGFLDYYHSTYGPFTEFPPHMYNHYRNITPRTINY
ncbi:unnamed protein product [Rotaria magnacalcarata]|nr:unnamed protein product [Rotaria magnacalcarata]